MEQKQSYKDALIDMIMGKNNNPYNLDTLKSLRVYMVQQIHDDLMMSRGQPIKKLDSQTLMMYNEIQWD